MSEQNIRETKTIEEIAMGFIDVANESMCRPIRSITQVLCIRYYFHIIVIII